MQQIFDLILRLAEIRKPVSQFLFSDAVLGLQEIELRKQVLKYKSTSGSIKEIDVIVNSPGGSADSAYRMIRTFRKNFEHVNIIVPFWAKSAATLLSLGGTKIIMDEYAEFGPLDVQLGKERNDSPEFDRESALNDEHSLRRIETRFKEMFEIIYVRFYEHKKINIPKSILSQQLFENLSKFYEPLLKQIDPYKLGDKRRKLDIGAQYAKRILAQFSSLKDKSQIRPFVDFLVDGCPDHGYVIDYDIMKLFLDNVYTGEEAFGKEYAAGLTELSFELLSLEEPIEYIGFIPDIELSNDESCDEELPEKVNGEIKETEIKESLKVKTVYQ